jgi:hypothetical protein
MYNIKHAKLIVSDMDGTLLNSRHELPSDFFEVLEKLNRKQIRFAIASGRSYPTLHAQFQNYKDQLIFIIENGCCIVDHDQPLNITFMDDAQLLHLDALCRQIPGVYPVFSCYQAAYIYRHTPDEANQIVHIYYENVRYIDQLSDIPETVYKVTVCDPVGAARHSFPVFSRLPSPYKATLGSNIWVDLGLENSNKGQALEMLQKKLGISPQETIVFGDYLNDCEMMQKAYFSYAMANAHPDLRAVSHFETFSNDEDGVMRIVRQLL